MAQTDSDEVCYITREMVQQAIEDENRFNRVLSRIDNCIRQASRDVEGLCHRTFYPWHGTRTFDNPRSDTLWLGQYEVLSVTSLSSGGTSLIAGDDYRLYPQEAPYTSIEATRGGPYWPTGATPQQDVSLTGKFGYTDRTIAAGVVSGSNLTDSSAQLRVSNGSLVGVLDLLKIDSEYLMTTGKTAVNSSQTIGANLTAKNNDDQVAVSDGTAFFSGETILVGSERMRINDISGNTLIVQRPVEGTALSAHTSGAAVWVYRLYDVTRAVVGTTAASHTTGTAINRHQGPSLVQELTMAYTIRALTQGREAYARTIGSGENQREGSGRGIKDIEKDCFNRYGRNRSR